eukprot:Hpha_TRINITY_DN15343_c2_g2::TRINITY_DN15343_c2_g2_i3::g.88370::m.88370
MRKREQGNKQQKKEDPFKRETVCNNFKEMRTLKVPHCFFPLPPDPSEYMLIEAPPPCRFLEISSAVLFLFFLQERATGVFGFRGGGGGRRTSKEGHPPPPPPPPKKKKKRGGG